MAEQSRMVSLRDNAWWGIGFRAETQVVLAGAQVMIAHMISVKTAQDCYIRVSQARVGPGLVGGVEDALVLASGVATPFDFNRVKIDSGFDCSVRLGPLSASTEKAVGSAAEAVAAKVARDLIKKLKAGMSRKIARFGVHHSKEAEDLHDNISNLFDFLEIVDGKPTIFVFPLGAGYGAAGYYEFGGSVELIGFSGAVAKALGFAP